MSESVHRAKTESPRFRKTAQPSKDYGILDGSLRFSEFTPGTFARTWSISSEYDNHVRNSRKERSRTWERDRCSPKLDSCLLHKRHAGVRGFKSVPYAPCSESMQTFLVEESSDKVSRNNENFMKKKQSDQWKRANRGSVTIKSIIRITAHRPELTARPYGFQRQPMRTGQKGTCGTKLP